MKKKFLFTRKIVSILLCVVLVFSLSVMSSAVNIESEKQFVPDNTVLLSAVKEVTDAYKEHYNINSMKINDTSVCDNGENGYFVDYFVKIEAVLKYSAATELPHVQGIANALGIDSKALTTAEFQKALESKDVQQSLTGKILDGEVDSALSSTNAMDSVKLKVNANTMAEDALSEINSFVGDIESNYIGKASAFNLAFRADFDSSGNLVRVAYDDYNHYVYNISDLKPESAVKMRAEGVQHFSDIVMNTSKQATDSEKFTTDSIGTPSDGTKSMLSNPSYSASRINITPLSNTTFTYYRVKARNYANTYTSNAAQSTCNNSSCSNYGGTIRKDTSYYNSNYSSYCCNDCANYVSQAMAYGGVPTSTTWASGKSAWTSCSSMKTYFTTTKNWWTASDFTNCNAGGVILLNNSSGAPYHAIMCVQNDTVTRAYSAHTNDRNACVYSSSSSFGASSVSYYIFDYSSTAT